MAILFSKVYTNYLQNGIHSIVFTAFTQYTSAKTTVARTMKSVYHSHPYVTHITDLCIYGYQYIPALYYDRPIEPFQSTWVTRNYLLGGQCKYMEHYHFIPEDGPHYKLNTFIRKVNAILSCLRNTPPNDTIFDKLLYAKYNNIYISRVQSPECVSIQSFDDFSKVSKVGFLSVSVVVPGGKYNIDINKAWMYVNNELFSMTFLKRYFEYNNIDCHLMSDYVLDIMDDNINMIQLKSNQYLLLQEKSYVVKTR
jgi:hypothetical protein